MCELKVIINCMNHGKYWTTHKYFFAKHIYIGHLQYIYITLTKCKMRNSNATDKKKKSIETRTYQQMNDKSLKLVEIFA